MEKRTLAYWTTVVWPKDKEVGLRLGQSFVNHFGFREMPELFHSRNQRETMRMIYDLADKYQL